MATKRQKLSGLAAACALVVGAPGLAFAADRDGTSGNDTIHGTDRADTINGFRGDDKLYGHAGADTIDGGGGADTVVGGDGPDDVKGGAGVDEIFGLNGNDILRARDDFADKVYCGPGNDRAYVDALDLFPTSELNRPQGTCEDIRWVKPWRLPIAVGDMPEGAGGLDDSHREYPSIDLQAPTGTPIRAIRGGYVEAAGWNPLNQSWCGKGVVIRGVTGGQYIYCHMNSVSVSQGQGIGSGRKVGTVGSTGNSTGPHLHLQIWKRSMHADGFYNSVCPQPMLTAINRGRTVPAPGGLPSSGCTY